MRQNLNKKEKDLYRYTDEVLHYLWDPIGVKEAPQARDEYRSYLPQVFSRLIGDARDHDIALYLDKIVTDSMGLSPDKQCSLEIAKLLIEAKEWILDDES